jgi:hypothetical protein
MQNTILYIALLGHETNFVINYLFFGPTNKNIQMHTSVGPSNYIVNKREIV